MMKLFEFRKTSDARVARYYNYELVAVIISLGKYKMA